MATISSFEDFKKEVKKRDIVNKAKAFARSAYERRYEIAGGILTAVMAVKTINNVVESANNRREQDCRIYDRSEGHYWRTKRKLSNSEYLEMEEIRNLYGCSKGEALNRMGLLKK